MTQCRLCGKLYDILIDLFLNDDSPHEISLISKLNSFLPSKIERIYGLSSKVCGKCVDRSLDAYDFIQVVMQTQQIFTGVDFSPKIPTNSIKYGTTTISSSNSQIDVKPSRTSIKRKTMNMSEALKKLKNIGSHITISKKIVAETTTKLRRTRTKQNYNEVDDSNDDENDISADDDLNDPVYCDDNNDDDNDDDDDDDDDTDIEYIPEMLTASKLKTKLPTGATSRSNGSGKKSYSVKLKSTNSFQANALFLCTKCNTKFPSFAELKMHLSGENNCNMSEFTCTICQRVCETKQLLARHMQVHKEKEKIICDRCGGQFNNYYSLERHAKQHSDMISDLPITYKCKVCEEKFNSRIDLCVHMKTHNTNDADGFLCHTCGKAYPSKRSLAKHVQNHSDVRPFICNFCEKGFRNRLRLRQHMHIHTGIKTFVCDQCPKQFAKADSLRSHRRKIHQLDSRLSSKLNDIESKVIQTETETVTAPILDQNHEPTEASHHFIDVQN